MRKSKQIKIDDQEILIKELRVRDIMDIFQAIGEADEAKSQDDIAIFKNLFTQNLLLITDIPLDKLIDMAPSEIKILWDAFCEVNDSFFGLDRRLKLDEIIERLREAILKDFSELAAGFFKQGMEKAPGNMDSASL